MLFGTTYTEDPSGLVSEITDTTTGSAGLAQTFGYDGADRLASVGPAAQGISTPVEQFSYDARNRPTTVANGGVLTQFNYAGASDELSSTSATMIGGLVASGATTRTFTYDGRGERVGSAVAGTSITNEYDYSAANELTRFFGAPVQPASGQALTDQVLAYRYTAEGLRTDFLYDLADGVAPTIIQGSNAEFIYGPDGVPVEELTPGVSNLPQTTQTPRYYVTDREGSVRKLLNTSGNVVASYAYDSFGANIASATSETGGTLLNPLRWHGQFLDLQSGLYYMNLRWYDPTTAQFLTPDPVGFWTADTYGYASDDPVNRSDPLGLCSFAQGDERLLRYELADAFFTLSAISALPFIGAMFPGYFAVEGVVAEEELTVEIEILQMVRQLAAMGPAALAGVTLSLAGIWTATARDETPN